MFKDFSALVFSCFIILKAMSSSKSAGKWKNQVSLVDCIGPRTKFVSRIVRSAQYRGLPLVLFNLDSKLAFSAINRKRLHLRLLQNLMDEQFIRLYTFYLFRCVFAAILTLIVCVCRIDIPN